MQIRIRAKREKGNSYIEYPLSLQPAGAGVFLRHGDDFLGEALGFFRFGPGRRDGFVSEEGSDEVAEEGLSVGGIAAEMAEFEVAAGHDEVLVEDIGLKGLGRGVNGGIGEVEKS